METKKERRFNTVRTFITVLIIMGTISLVIIMQGVNAYVQNISLTEDAKEELLNMAGASARTINEWIEKQEHIATSIKTTFEFTEDIDDAYIEEYLELRLKENSDALMYYIVFASDKIISADHTQITGLVDIDQREYWIKAMEQKKVIFTEPYLDEVSKKMLVSMACPITIKGEQVALVADITMDSIGEIVHMLMTNKDEKAFLINENGTIMVHENEEFEPNEKGNTYLHDVVEADLNSNEVETIIDYDGRKEYIATSEIKASGWKIGVLKSRESITDVVKHYVLIDAIAAMLFVCVAMPIVYIIIGKKLAPISLLEKHLRHMEEGNLNVLIERTKRQDDVGGLQNAAAGLVNELTQIMKDMNVALGELAKGNLRITDVPEYKGEFNQLSDSVNAIKNTLYRVICEISENANSVGRGSNELSDAATSLAQGTTEQAASMQNIELRLVSIAEQVGTNSDNCGVIQTRFEEFESLIECGNENMKHLLENVNEVENMSETINRIVKTIDAIAFQTNILSLNATVEAARAGNNGKGFAVVAEEVRNLANRSTDESAKTAELIGECISLISKVKECADKTMENFEEIVKDSKEITDAFNKIAVATNDQKEGTGMIKKEVESIASVIQNSSAITEETAASAVTLSEQADSMNRLIHKFRL